MKTAEQSKNTADSIKQTKITQIKSLLETAIDNSAKNGSYTFTTKAYDNAYNKELKEWLTDLGYRVNFKKGQYFTVSWDEVSNVKDELPLLSID